MVWRNMQTCLLKEPELMTFFVSLSIAIDYKKFNSVKKVCMAPTEMIVFFIF